jgi:hypothetical protein
MSVRYLRTMFLPEDELCFHLFEADSSDVSGRLLAEPSRGASDVSRPWSSSRAFRLEVRVMREEKEDACP